MSTILILQGFSLASMSEVLDVPATWSRIRVFDDPPLRTFPRIEYKYRAVDVVNWKAGAVGVLTKRYQQLYYDNQSDLQYYNASDTNSLKKTGLKQVDMDRVSSVTSQPLRSSPSD